MLETNDLQATISFYITNLGFTVQGTFDHGDGVPVWASIRHGPVEIMFKTPNPVMNYGQVLLTGNLYITTSNVDELWLQVKDLAEVVYPIEDFPYQMREFAIKDNNGYVLSFGMDISGGTED